MRSVTECRSSKQLLSYKESGKGNETFFFTFHPRSVVAEVAFMLNHLLFSHVATKSVFFSPSIIRVVPPLNPQARIGQTGLKQEKYTDRVPEHLSSFSSKQGISVCLKRSKI